MELNGIPCYRAVCTISVSVCLEMTITLNYYVSGGFIYGSSAKYIQGNLISILSLLSRVKMEKREHLSDLSSPSLDLQQAEAERTLGRTDFPFINHPNVVLPKQLDK